MKRTNTFGVVPQSTEDEELLRRLLDASAALWNEINYERRENFADPDADVFDISEYRGKYAGVLGASTVQQVERKNREAWRSFLALKKKGEAAGKPGFWGNREDGRELLGDFLALFEKRVDLHLLLDPLLELERRELQQLDVLDLLRRELLLERLLLLEVEHVRVGPGDGGIGRLGVGLTFRCGRR